MSKRLFASCATIIVTALVLAGCGGDGEDKEGGSAGKGGRPPGTNQSQWIASPIPTRVDLLALDKTSDKAVTARLRFANFGPGPYGACPADLARPQRQGNLRA